MTTWRFGRCPCCYKKTRIVLGTMLQETGEAFDNAMSRACAVRLARLGTCPWCGRVTTLVARKLLERFEPHLARLERTML